MKSVSQARTQLTWEEHVQDWLDKEREDYASQKFDRGNQSNRIINDALRTEGLGETCLDFVGNYLKRASILGVNTPSGRQALGKATVTLIDYLEQICEIYGPMPKPGVPSGTIEDWIRENG